MSLPASSHNSPTDLDIEKAAHINSLNTSHTSSSTAIHHPDASEPQLVVEDHQNPRNWPNRRRWTVTIVVSFFTFMSPVASSISSPSLSAISADLNISSGSVLENMTLSIFVLAYAIGFLVFNTVCGFAKTPTQLLVFRFLAGFGGAASQSISGAIVGDMWSPDERAIAMSLYSIAPLVGPSTGPLVGGWIAEKSNWHWVFWSVSIADAILQIAAFLFLRETYAPELLRRKARSARKLTGNPKLCSAFEDTNHSWTTVMGREPAVQVFALYMAVLHGVLYLTLTTFVKVFTLQYGEGPGIAGIHYLAIALGSTVGGQVAARVLTRVYLHLKAKNRGIGVPEMSIEFKGANWTCIQTYLVDSYAIHTASAIGGVSSFRAFAGFGFPLFADEVYQLGDGAWGNSILALICLVIGCPAPFVFYRYGARLRARSRGSSVE
ncbi:MFS general substrate transporter [Mycena albidolilacea]|uniref:MFS general substrate transporter n=1 Tax=Mycena albidolilacea TaxID=1033008 RepID=A0AAD6ZJB1_9AGAR|nr:MFS general substrate transporter [Mycena albidolilacea]